MNMKTLVRILGWLASISGIIWVLSMCVGMAIADITGEAKFMYIIFSISAVAMVWFGGAWMITFEIQSDRELKELQERHIKEMQNW